VKLLALIRAAAAAIADSPGGQVNRFATVETRKEPVPTDDQPVAIMLDFVDPIGTGWRL
jgi:hypothetical protein